jgi:1,4-alpha-glucan branching enzyme
MSAGSFGVRPNGGGVVFRLWAPAAQRVDVMLDRPHSLQRLDEGWFAAEIPDIKAGAPYRFRIDGATAAAGGWHDTVGTIIWSGGLTGTLSPWSVHWRLGDP